MKRNEDQVLEHDADRSDDPKENQRRPGEDWRKRKSHRIGDQFRQDLAEDDQGEDFSDTDRETLDDRELGRCERDRGDREVERIHRHVRQQKRDEKSSWLLEELLNNPARTRTFALQAPTFIGAESEKDGLGCRADSADPDQNRKEQKHRLHRDFHQRLAPRLRSTSRAWSLDNLTSARRYATNRRF